MHVVRLRCALPGTSLFFMSLSLSSSLMVGCGAPIQVNLNTIASISAPANTLRVNQTLQLSSLYMASGQAMNFYVNGIEGGNADVGTVSSTGLYTAPAVVPNPYTVQITSQIARFPGAVPGSVSVQVWNPIPVLGAVNPGGFSEGETMVTVSGSQFVYGAQISWNGAMVPTTYVSGTAASSARSPRPHPGTFPLDGDKSRSWIGQRARTAIVVVGPGQVVLQLEPDSGTDVRVSNHAELWA